MKYTLLLLLFSVSIGLPLQSQSCRDASVELSAVVQPDPPVITINWVPNDSATRHFVYRKLKNSSSWGSVVANLPGNATSYTDTTVQKGISYEYRVFRQANNFSGHGYINSGIEIPLVEQRGRILLVIDETFSESLQSEIDRLVDDLEGDGWRVKRIDVSPTWSVNAVKMLIQDAYSEDPVNTRTAFLLGRVPVPYSGEINVDGHSDHTGAYPADVYYADLNGVWTDNAVNNTTASDPRNHNVPEDGKFDQALFPTDLELQLGRVDFSNMNGFGLTEEEMLRNYLDKDHEYRHRVFTPMKRMLIDDNFGYFSGEAFAAGGWRNAGPLVGNQNAFAGKYFPTLNDSSYLWSYGCGGGWYQGAGGVGTSQDFASGNTQTVFTMLFGSYFGDWDTPDNFLRAPLAKGKALTNVWSGRPHWQFHHMGLGEHIGYSVRVSQNNNGIYDFNFGARVVHMAFMGDPTLRNDMVSPVNDVMASADGYQVNVSWSPSEDEVLGYHIYRRTEGEESYQRINSDIITETTFTDSCTIAGIHEYMVRAVLLQTSPGGTYFNMSQGIKDTSRVTQDYDVIANAVFVQDENGVTAFTNLSTNANSYLWEFGDGATSQEKDPVHTYQHGEYIVYLYASNACDVDTFVLPVSIITASSDPVATYPVILSPNPVKDHFTILLPGNVESCLLDIYDFRGRKVKAEQTCSTGDKLDVSQLPHGMYLVRCFIRNTISHLTFSKI